MKPESQLDAISREWCLANRSQRVQLCLAGVLRELNDLALFHLRTDPRCELMILPEAGHSVWAHFPIHRRRSVARLYGPRPETRVLLVLSERHFSEQSAEQSEDELRDHLGHTLLYLRDPKARNECEEAAAEWKAQTAWFERLLDRYWPDCSRSCSNVGLISDEDWKRAYAACPAEKSPCEVACRDFHKQLTERKQQYRSIWKALDNLHLDESQTAELLGHCWDYGFARWQDKLNSDAVAGPLRGMGKIEKELDRQAEQLAKELRSTANTLVCLRSAPASDSPQVSRALSSMLWSALHESRYRFCEESGKDKHEVFEKFPLLIDNLEGLADAIEVCRQMETQAVLFDRMRENALFGTVSDRASEWTRGMVELANGEYGTLAALVKALYPEFDSITGQELKREVERRLSKLNGSN
jgi:hypothetical protein